MGLRGDAEIFSLESRVNPKCVKLICVAQDPGVPSTGTGPKTLHDDWFQLIRVAPAVAALCSALAEHQFCELVLV